MSNNLLVSSYKDNAFIDRLKVNNLLVSNLNNYSNITEEDVANVQNEWANGVVQISSDYLNGKDFIKTANNGLDHLYGYQYFDVAFKPTKTVNQIFRDTRSGALSYFIGYNNVPPGTGYSEDKGFAINGGKGWSNVRFNNHKSIIYTDFALAYGIYFFTNAQDDTITEVEYTFGYKRSPTDGRLVIILQHSSLPFRLIDK